MNLFIVRHGHSPMQSSDHARPLSETGQRQAQQAGRFIHQNNPISPLIICSDATRTQQTAEQIAQVLATEDIQADNCYYAAGVGVWCDALSRHAEQQTIILVGHNPTVTQLNHYLSGQTEFIFKPACVAHLRLEIDADGLRLPAQLVATFQPETQ